MTVTVCRPADLCSCVCVLTTGTAAGELMCVCVCVCVRSSCGQCVKEDDHHRRHPVLPLPGSGSSQRRKTRSTFLKVHSLVESCVFLYSRPLSYVSLSLSPSGAVLSYPISGQLSGGFQRPHPQRDRHEGMKTHTGTHTHTHIHKGTHIHGDRQPGSTLPI